MRRKSKIDANQPDIVARLRELGASVQPLHAVGKGCPDLLVGFRGRNFLLEVKNLDGKRLLNGKPELTPDQKDWFDKWRGKAVVVENEAQAVDALL